MSLTKLCAGRYVISFGEYTQGKFGIFITQTDEDSVLFENKKPLYIFTKTLTATTLSYSEPYSCVRAVDGGIEASGRIMTDAGSVFDFTDIYAPADGDGFRISRRVTVIKAESSDIGFASKIYLDITQSQKLTNFNCFAPGVWYRQNEFVPEHFIGYSLDVDYYWMYETQYALPLFAVQNICTGDTVCLSREKADVVQRSYDGRLGDQQVDETIRFGSIGISVPEGLSVDYVYPGAQGTTIRLQIEKDPGGLPIPNKFIPLYHPVLKGYSDNYSVVIDFDRNLDYRSLMRDIWRKTYRRFDPQIAPIDNKLLYHVCMKLLKEQTLEHNGSWGLPFNCFLPSGDPHYVAYQFGFVGQQPNIGYHLMRYGKMYNDSEAFQKGRNIIQFWVNTSLNKWGAPNIWYNPGWEKYEDRPVWLRMVGDGMEGILDAYLLLKNQGEEREDWHSYCTTVADWLVRSQTEDGSWYRSYDHDGHMLMESKANTTNVIRFLVQCYIAFGGEQYKEAALKAGEWGLEHVYKEMEYRGGTCDNSDIYDKESGIYAIFAFLALYDMTGDAKWLEATKSAADYVETWTYAWAYPVRVKYPSHPFREKNITGQSLIATGHSGADMYMASCSFIFYRLYLITEDEHYLHFARFIHNNPKQGTDYDGRFGFKHPGMCQESGEFYDQVMGGVYQWLPWCTYVEVDPIARLMDAFEVYEIEDAEKLPLMERKSRNRIYDGFGG